MATELNPVDYQISPDFAGDKEALWPYPKEKDGWTYAHNSLRGEMETLRQVLQQLQKRGSPLVGWEATALVTAIGNHQEHVHGHHSNEDQKFMPELEKRFKVPKKLHSDHEKLIEKLHKIDVLRLKLKEGSTVDQLCQEFVEYESMMRDHLQEEEDVALPLYRAYFTPKEGAALVQSIIKGIPKFEMGSFIYYMGAEKFRSEFMKQEGIPFFVWYLEFGGMHKVFVEGFAKPMEALQSGVEPVADKSWWQKLVGGK